MEHSPLPLTLCIDTAEGGTSLALGDAGGLRASSSLADVSRQSEQLVVMIEALLKETKLHYADVRMVAVNIGPGSFTGIRVGVATARALALGLAIPCHGVTGLQRTAHAAKAGRALTVAQEALRGQCYWQAFDENIQPLTASALEDHAPLAARLANGFVTGSGVASLVAHGLPQPSVLSTPAGPDAVAIHAFLAREGGCAWQDSLQVPQPLYIRQPDAKLPTPFLRGNP
jgi:tRNA threonylcarbamoyladenosine biosynthesis protein TsaB